MIAAHSLALRYDDVQLVMAHVIMPTHSRDSETALFIPTHSRDSETALFIPRRGTKVREFRLTVNHVCRVRIHEPPSPSFIAKRRRKVQGFAGRCTAEERQDGRFGALQLRRFCCSIVRDHRQGRA